MEKNYEVIVGNIGTVYDGPELAKAREHFDHYIEKSKTNLGRAGGESVFLIEDQELVAEFTGAIDNCD